MAIRLSTFLVTFLAATAFAGMSLIATQSEAATLNLSPGESVLIQPNVTTTVICGTGSPVADCTKAIKVFESRFATCKKTYPSSTCYQNEWPAFKSRSPECVAEAFDACYRVCNESYPGSTCYQNCR